MSAYEEIPWRHPGRSSSGIYTAFFVQHEAFYTERRLRDVADAMNE